MLLEFFLERRNNRLTCMLRYGPVFSPNELGSAAFVPILARPNRADAASSFEFVCSRHRVYKADVIGVRPN